MFRDNQSGIIAILTALFIFAIVMMIALAIDTSLAASSRNQYQRTMEHAALGALETYTLAPAKFAPPAKLDEASKRASEIANRNLDPTVGVALARSFYQDPSKPQDDLKSRGASSANGNVIAGRWHFVEADYKKCGIGDQFVPCFEELDLATVDPSDPNQQVNAIKILAHLNESSPLKTVFAKVGFINTVTFQAEAIATMVPRYNVFAIDLSESITFDTHPDSQLPRYEFMVRPDRDCPVASKPLPSDVLITDPYPADHKFAYESMAPTGPPHVRADYECVTLQNTTDPSDTRCEGQTYYLDVGTPPSAPKVQPLTAVLGGVHRALEKLRERGVGADRMGMLPFDEDVLPCRATWDVTKKSTAMVEPSSQQYSGFLEATDQTRRVTDPVVYSKFLFPRPLNDDYTQNVRTNIVKVLDEARTLILKQAAPEAATKQVFLFTDGLNQCDRTQCKSKKQFVYDSLKIIDEIAKQYQKDNIQLHVFLFGDRSGAHEIFFRAPTGGCASGEVFDTSDDVSHPERWMGVNTLMKDAILTNGVATPIRRPCPSDIRNNLTQMCEGTAPNQRVDLTPLCATDPNMCPYVDSRGRLFCDPAASSTDDQVANTIERIMARNPFILVQERR